MIVFGAREIASLVARVLTKKQLEIFFAITQICTESKRQICGIEKSKADFSINGFQNFTFSKTVKELSKTYPQSTAKHVLKHLRHLGLVDFENGQPLYFTKLGSLIRDGLENGNNK